MSSPEPSTRHRRRTPELEVIEALGPWSFVTFRRGRLAGQPFVWRSREHRKGLLARAEADIRASGWRGRFLAPARLNSLIGCVFAFGSLLFLVGSILTLVPAWAQALGLTPDGVNTTYFIGSIWFTAAAWLQLFQAANAGGFTPGPASPRRARLVLIGWLPGEIGWLACFLQFIGTLLFNVSTFAALGSGGDWLRQDVEIWAPDLLGSVLFLASGYLAVVETVHRYWGWQPRSLSWWVVFTNFLGCIAFMASAFLAYVPADGASAWAVALSVLLTGVGAVGFLAGSLLMLPEAAGAGGSGGP